MLLFPVSTRSFSGLEYPKEPFPAVSLPTRVTIGHVPHYPCLPITAPNVGSFILFDSGHRHEMRNTPMAFVIQEISCPPGVQAAPPARQNILRGTLWRGPETTRQKPFLRDFWNPQIIGCKQSNPNFTCLQSVSIFSPGLTSNSGDSVGAGVGSSSTHSPTTQLLTGMNPPKPPLRKLLHKSKRAGNLRNSSSIDHAKL